MNDMISATDLACIKESNLSIAKNLIDMDIQQTDKESGVRPVNINTIKYLIFDGVKYVVE